MDKSLMEMAVKIVKRADTIGCVCATQIGEMPTRDEIKARIKQALESDDFETVAAHALFGLMLFQKSSG